MRPFCDRCGQEAFIVTTSMFNTDTICINCKKKEKRHPDYKKAVQAELQAVRSGDYNFPGIGKPTDL